MLIRISLIVAIIAGLAVGVLNFIKVKEKIVALQTELAATKKTLQETQLELGKTKKNLADTTAKLKQTETTLVATTDELQKTQKDLDTQTKRADKLTDDLAKTRKERDDAQADLAAYTATGVKPPQIIAFQKDIKNLQDSLAGSQEENKVLGRKVSTPQARLDRFENPDKPVFLPAQLTGKVLVTDPKWNFVVLSVGQDQGVLESGELLVNRNGKLVAKVVVRSVQKDRSIANVLPGWQLGEIIEGDMVIPAHPAS